MAGAVVMIVILLVALPVAVLVGSSTLAAALGWLLRREGEVLHEGSELVDLNT